MSIKLPTFPEPVKTGDTIVTIYHNQNDGYDVFKVVYYQQGKRKSESFSKYPKAKKRAKEVGESKESGDIAGISLTSSQRLEYSHALQMLSPLGVSLPDAILQYAAAKKVLGENTLQQAADEYRKRHPLGLKKKPLREIADEYLASLKARQCSFGYQNSSRIIMQRMTEAFKMEIASITAPEILKLIDKAGYKARSFMTYRGSLKAFFEYAKQQDYLAPTWQEMDKVEKRRLNTPDIEIFTPTEIAKILNEASVMSEFSKRFVPIYAIGAFSGIRIAEILRLDWKQIGVGGGKFIEIKADNAKTRKRRLIPITDNLRAWLKPYIKNEGKLWTISERSYPTLSMKLMHKIGIKGKRNALRHSYITYRVAQCADVARVSLEAGNSPSIIFQHYLQLVTPEQAETWFNVMPGDADEKIVHLKTAEV